MRRFAALLLLATLSTAIMAGGSRAAEFRAGATVQVKPNSIWFDDAAGLAQWRRVKKAAGAKAVAAYESRILGRREAWQFINPLAVKILRHDPRTNRVTVEMITEGRLQGSTWVLAADALAP
ncbi:MAG: hypothetical protein HXX10_00690 [Rhodoplanes sp.]|uniref:hypothetical protein n=1 Tax=Rhodoplanes sp. TaxID=1968906 RepID=UPI0017CBE06F|nr:hypothetical protein [Rhodoplanes sp.]NVO12532.1 hypothetical protein [Rhodoplanes sp.]